MPLWIWKHTPGWGVVGLYVFSGSAVVAYMYESKGIAVVANDRLRYCHHAGRATIENRTVRLSDEDTGRRCLPTTPRRTPSSGTTSRASSSPPRVSTV